MKAADRRLLLLAVGGLLAAAYWYGAVRQLLHVNTDIRAVDQLAYIDYAQELRRSNFTRIPEYNRVPLYPLIQSVFFQEELTEYRYFQAGKFNNVVLSLGLLIAFGVLAAAEIGDFGAAVLTLLTAFEVFVFKAGWFQAELLFYFLNFVLFLLMWRILQRPTWRRALAAGATAALAHLTKASVIPGLLLFLLVLLAQGLADVVAARRGGPAPGSGPPSAPFERVLLAALIGVVFLAVQAPYQIATKRETGRYFYNVNSTFYLWYDSWAQAKAGTRAHGDHSGWPDMPPEQIPTLQSYLRDHSVFQILGRIRRGADTVLDKVRDSYGYHRFVLLYAGLAAAAALWKWRQAVRGFRQHRGLWLFVIFYFGGYALLYFWYAPIASGNRLILGQFMPLMFTLFVVVDRLLAGVRLGVGGRTIAGAAAVNALVLLLLLPDIYLVVTRRVVRIVGGF